MNTVESAILAHLSHCGTIQPNNRVIYLIDFQNNFDIIFIKQENMCRFKKCMGLMPHFQISV